MEPKTIFEDKFILVIDKPAGWIVNEAETTTNQPVVQTWLRKSFKYPIVNTTSLRSGVVHRLDKETSGLLLVAKTKTAFENLQAQFKGREVKKTYTALVHGKVEPKEGEIKTPVGRLPWRRDRFGVLPGGREAITKYKVLEYFGDRGGKLEKISSIQLQNPASSFQHPASFSLLELTPKTGRTHQIRVHLKHIGHAIVSDEFYAGRKTARNDRKWCSRLFLHASEISFKHPKDSEELSFKSETPEDLKISLARLEEA